MFSKWQSKPYIGSETKLRNRGVYTVTAIQFANRPGLEFGVKAVFACKSMREARKIAAFMKEDKENEWREVWIDKYLGKRPKRHEVTVAPAHWSDPDNLFSMAY